MEQRTVIGLGICALLIAFGFAVNGNMGLYFNIAALFIVLGGTFGAAFLSFRTERLSIVLKVLLASYRTRIKTPEDIVEILVDLSVKSRLKGILSLQEDEDETSIMFLRRALGFLVDGYTKAQITEILNTEMYFFKLRRDESERALRSIADLCPSFGLVGSVVGLIGMLSGIDNTAIVIATIPIALSSTLYGIIIANMILIPLAANIAERTQQELLLQKMVLEGVLAIKNNSNPRILENRLKSFLTPSSRNTRLISLETIKERLKDYNSVDLRPPARQKVA